MTYPLRVNGELHTVDVDGDTPLLWVLRDVLGFNGTKFGCGMGLCGACTVHVDGRPARSCVIAVQTLGEASITTIESASTLAVGRHVQQAWLARNVPQCGYCQSGQIMAAISLICGRSTRATQTSTRRCPATCVAAAPTCASALP